MFVNIKAQLFLKIYAELDLWNTYNRATAAAVSSCAGGGIVFVRKTKDEVESIIIREA